MNRPLRIEAEGRLLFIEQEGGYACPSITVGDTEIGTAVEEWMKVNRAKLQQGDHVLSHHGGLDGFLPGRYRVLIERIE